MLEISQYFLKTIRPNFLGYLSKFFYLGSRITFGRRFKADSIPKLIVDRGCYLAIGDNVEFRRSIEIRVHKGAQVFIKNNVRVDRAVRILATNQSVIDISEGVRIGLNTVLNGGESITIGKKSLISGFVFLQTSMHGFRDQQTTVQDQGYGHAAVTLEEDTWLGAHVVIMPGVTVRKGGVVGSNAVVNNDVEPYQVVAGIPAKPISQRR